jgi:hypothetical protein
MIWIAFYLFILVYFFFCQNRAKQGKHDEAQKEQRKIIKIFAAKSGQSLEQKQTAPAFTNASKVVFLTAGYRLGGSQLMKTRRFSFHLIQNEAAKIVA